MKFFLKKLYLLKYIVLQTYGEIKFSFLRHSCEFIYDGMCWFRLYYHNKFSKSDLGHYIYELGWISKHIKKVNRNYQIYSKLISYAT